MNVKFIILAIILAMAFLTGCSAKVKKIPLEDVGMVGVMAIDYIDENSLKLTVAIPQYSPVAKEHTQIFSVTTELVSQGIVDIEALSDKKVVLNQLRVVLLNEEFARHGKAREIIKHLFRNAEVGNKVLIAVVKESGEEILKEEYPDKPNINFYLNDLLQPSINTAFNPNTNIHDFVYTQTNPVFDSIVPLLEKKEGKIEINGIALFKGEKMLRSLSKDDALIIQALQGRKKLAPLYIKLNDNNKEEKMMLDLINSKVRMKGNKSVDSPKLTVSLKIEGTLVEYKGEREGRLSTPEEILKLEEDVNKEIEKDISKFLESLKELKVDPIGLTEKFRMHYHGDWDKTMTRETISKLQWDIHVETSIVSTGTLR
ncbi:Ger(x)C family spore germination protein [Psychrobacillus sp. FSL H8-0483]|uniref:Ger(x)C family spore germination protein n=1 Tax=Psychrobacillus sp. FSL H8-0483 TaxID=2921389 RepID=UPI003159F5CA